jgi:predicted MPP superfamily phosphohydrolase
MKKPGIQMSRRRFIGGVSLLAATGFSYAHFVEPRWLQVSRVQVPLWNGARAPLKLLHISDLHASPLVSLRFISEAIETALQFKPDLICVTGDFVTATFDEMLTYTRILRRLSSAAPCFAVLGNHDGGVWAREHGGHKDLVWVSELLRESEITLLQNCSSYFARGDWELNLVGVGDLWSGPFEPDVAFAGLRDKSPVLLLAHNPDSKDELISQRWDLMLAGHTHGGQFRMPWIGTPFAPVKDKRFVAGLHRWNDRWLHVTKGIGNVLGMRINCPPEVSFLTLA